MYLKVNNVVVLQIFARITVEEFILLGLSSNCHLNIILCVVLLVVFLLSIMGNIIVVTLPLRDHRLQSPMYFFPRNFCLLEICFTSVVMPRFLHSLLTERKAVTLEPCLLQSFFFFFLGSSTFFHLALMSFDRYVAICNLLHYITVMSNRVCLYLVLGCWLVSFLLVLPTTVLFVRLPFCGLNIINHFYCDTAPLLQLSCTDTGIIELVALVTAVLTLFSTLTVTIISYGCIISTVMRIPSSMGRKKAFSTCSTHLTVVVILYSSSIFRYIRPSQRGGWDFDNVMSFLYTVVTQLFNPYIYALRNEHVKQALKDACDRENRLHD
ncbi:olfactory receptor 6C4-like [Trachemys scripta elegans]|uniref:olfactory receptor 6C4-like n=1 Tax=Trachemys scripta elegans TaxID=31138 RepID=UPI0015553B1E|nr:olfactory receptor 6C4-like [Trachemys scripta elegans]